eukprot:c15603_g1_i1 orf=481-1638(-)
MSLLDGTPSCYGVLELCAHTHIPPLSRTIRRSNRLCCYAKIKVDGNEAEHETSRKGFSIRVPTMPKLGDIESARRVLESAFHALSLEMPKIPIDSALQGLSFDISKLSIPKQVLVFDIRGFVATKLKRPQREVADTVLDEGQYPRCAWPRTMKGAHVAEASTIGTLENLQGPEIGLNQLAEESVTAYPRSKWPRAMRQSGSSEAELPAIALSLGTVGDEASFNTPVGPHCAWPRKANQFVNSNGALTSQSIKEEVSPCIIEGGPRCAWPRKTVFAKQSCYTENTTDISEVLPADVSQREKSVDGAEVLPVDFEGAAELPRRLLATSVGLTVMNQLAKGSIVTSLFDFCSLLPAGPLGITEEEDAALDLGRRTLLVFIKSSASQDM